MQSRQLLTHIPTTSLQISKGVCAAKTEREMFRDDFLECGVWVANVEARSHGKLLIQRYCKPKTESIHVADILSSFLIYISCINYLL